MANKDPQDNSFLYILFTVLLILTLFEKSSVRQDLLDKVSQKTSLKNYSHEADLNEIPVSEDLPEIDNELYIAELEDDDIHIESSDIPNDSVTIYFLKFYGQGQKSHSRLISVNRTLTDNTVQSVLDQLINGPTENEKKKGVLSAIPNNILYDRNYTIKNKVLHISFSGKIEYGAGPDLMNDRLDQIIYTLLELEDIDGIKLYIDGKKVSSIGGDGISLPNILTRRERRIMNL